MAGKYRVDSIEINGFKGFTNQQKVSVNGKTTFIFGTNAVGKSSIVESVVWCLYGTEKNVKNQFYQGPCVVSLNLCASDDPSKIWKITRRMHRGDNESDVDVHTPSGTRINITDFLPQLKKLEHGSGTRVIFAEQEPGRRYAHDINDFEPLIAAYLGLDIAYSLIEWLENFIEAQEADFEVHVRSKETALSEEITKRAESIHERIGYITSQPPWEGIDPPGESETLEKVKSFCSSIFTLMNDVYSPEAGGSVTDILDLCDTKIDSLESLSKTSLEKAKGDLEQKIRQATDLRGSLNVTLQAISDASRSLQAAKSELANLTTTSGTESSLAEEKTNLTNTQGELINRSLLLNVASIISVSRPDRCPVCDREMQPAELKNHLDLAKSHVSDSTRLGKNRVDEIDAISNRYSKFRDARDHATTQIGLQKQNQSMLESQISVLLGLETVALENIDAKIIELRSSVTDLESKISEASAKLVGFRSQLGKFRQIIEYHKAIRYLARITDFQNSEEYISSMAKIREFDSYIHSLKKIHSELEKAYVAAFSAYLPILQREMTKVYRELTQQKSFDSIRIRNEPANPINKTKRKIILEVGSAADEVWVIPSERMNVLNGQALSALNLVPYFAFSALGLSKHEIDFLLIDDPSQSFDMSHIDYLLSILKPVAESAQVIIATHERDRFEPKLPTYFGNSTNVISVDSFDRKSGPHLVAA